MFFFKRKSPVQLADLLVRKVANESFGIWEHGKFRDFINFDKIDKTERDRIFNELVVTTLGLLDLNLSWQLYNNQNLERQTYIDGVRKAAVKRYPEWLEEMGVEKKFLKLWRKLIKLRFKEYRDHLGLAMGEAKFWEEFRGKPEFRDAWARIETCAICGLQHIRRGKTTPKDPLWRYLRKWLTRLDVDILKETQDNNKN